MEKYYVILISGISGTEIRRKRFLIIFLNRSVSSQTPRFWNRRVSLIFSKLDGGVTIGHAKIILFPVFFEIWSGSQAIFSPIFQALLFVLT